MKLSSPKPSVKMPRPVRIVALTEAGQRLGQRLQSHCEGADLWYKPKPFVETVQQAFQDGDALILITATGIAVRSLAPVLESKQQDAPVLVLDELGQFVIPLLSGHEGGANDWASDVAASIDAQLVMTTAKPYLKPVYAVGMGCERDCPREHLQTLFEACLTEAGLSLDQISSINSIALKADEAGLIQLGEILNKPYQTFEVDQLSKMEPLLSTRSDYVLKTVGVYGVAESAALYAAAHHVGRASELQAGKASQLQVGDAPELILNKQKTKKATCAIARAYPIGQNSSKK